MNSSDLREKVEFALYFISNIEIKNFNKTKESLIAYSQESKYKLNKHAIIKSKGKRCDSGKTVYIVTGPIGSGKSAIAENLIRIFGLHQLNFVSPDIYYKIFYNDIDDFQDRYEMGKKYAGKKQKQLIRSNKSFIVETVIAKEEKFDFIKECKKAHYKIIGFYVGVESPSICVCRTKQRHHEGEHDVSKEKIITRYFECMKNLYRFCKLTDELYVIDNTEKKPKLMMYKNDKKQFVVPKTTAWFREFYIEQQENDEETECT
jgi:predicted ABC-type ATPase